MQGEVFEVIEKAVKTGIFMSLTVLWCQVKKITLVVLMIFTLCDAFILEIFHVLQKYMGNVFIDGTTWPLCS